MPPPPLRAPTLYRQVKMLSAPPWQRHCSHALPPWALVQSFPGEVAHSRRQQAKALQLPVHHSATEQVTQRQRFAPLARLASLQWGPLPHCLLQAACRHGLARTMLCRHSAEAAEAATQHSARQPALRGLAPCLTTSAGQLSQRRRRPQLVSSVTCVLPTMRSQRMRERAQPWQSAPSQWQGQLQHALSSQRAPHAPPPSARHETPKREAHSPAAPSRSMHWLPAAARCLR